MRVKKALSVLAVMLAAGAALGHGMIPRDAPAERLVKNFEAKLKEHPEDAETQYRLGRVHLLVLERKSGLIPVWENRNGREDEPTEGAWSKRGGFGEEKKEPDLKEDELAGHLTEAIKHLNKAIALRPDEARYHLTLASVLEAGLSLREKVDEHPCSEISGEAEKKSELGGSCAEVVKKVLAGDAGAQKQAAEWLTQHSWNEGPSFRDVLQQVDDFADRRGIPGRQSNTLAARGLVSVPRLARHRNRHCSRHPMSLDHGTHSVSSVWLRLRARC